MRRDRAKEAMQTSLMPKSKAKAMGKKIQKGAQQEEDGFLHIPFILGLGLRVRVRVCIYRFIFHTIYAYV